MIRKHGSTIEPPDAVSLRLDELAVAKLLTLADTRVIRHELNTVARVLKRVGYLKSSRPATIAAANPESLRLSRRPVGLS